MFWSLVRPDRILPPITKSAAVTTSLETDESAVGNDQSKQNWVVSNWAMPQGSVRRPRDSHPPASPRTRQATRNTGTGIGRSARHRAVLSPLLREHRDRLPEYGKYWRTGARGSSAESPCWGGASFFY